MNFKILLIDNRPDELEHFRKVVQAYEELGGSHKMTVKLHPSADGLDSVLDDGYDLILADVMFGTAEEPEADSQEGISRILMAVEEWKSKANVRSLPVIAYTAHSDTTIRLCLEHRWALYDLWDKWNDPAYHGWRLGRVASELENRGGTVLQRAIRGMETGASWHSIVCKMTRKFEWGVTEHDQIVRVGDSIRDIAYLISNNVGETAAVMWKTMQDWEFVSRHSFPSTRGHCRHVVHVFWLGYYLLHHPDLRGVWVSAWEHIYANRPDASGLQNMDPLTALSEAWFLASLFHDAGSPVQKSKHLVEGHFGLLRALTGVQKSLPPGDLSETWRSSGSSLLSDVSRPMANAFQKLYEGSIGNGAPDHGVVSGLLTMDRLQESTSRHTGREAAIAMALHNLYPDAVKQDALTLSWESEPLAALLILCDQLQTWDRERDTQTRDGPDTTERAELAELEVKVVGTTLRVVISVNYLSPAHMRGERDQYERLEETLKKILREHPRPAVAALRDWPFQLQVNFLLDGTLTLERFHFPES